MKTSKEIIPQHNVLLPNTRFQQKGGSKTSENQSRDSIEVDPSFPKRDRWPAQET
jgi:hypothetical protein